MPTNPPNPTPVSLIPFTLSSRSTSRVMTRTRRRILIEQMLDGKTLKQAGTAAGYSPKSAENYASQVVRSPVVQETYRQILERVGLSDDYLAQKGMSLLNAKQSHFFQKDGIVTDERVVDALETQRKTWVTVNQLAGHLKEKGELDIRIGIMAMVVDALQSPDDRR
jgi:phage terminase small subunit